MNTRRLWERRQDTEPDSDAPPAGSGWTGTGGPLEIGTGLLHREYCDGMGLCSPGRWRPSSRRFPSTAHWLRIAQLFYDFQDEVQLAKLLAETRVRGGATGPSFEISCLPLCILRLSRRGDLPDLTVDYRLLCSLLCAAGDPDGPSPGEFARGVRLGVGLKTPRRQAVYSRKVKWRLPEQRQKREPADQEEGTHAGAWRSNFSSVEGLQKEVEAVILDQYRRGQFLRLTPAQAKARFGSSLVVASLGAVRKENSQGEVSARVVYDATHGVRVNSLIRMRDQDRAPTAPDLKTALREQHEGGGRSFGITSDVSEAHRLVLLDPRDYHFVGCQLNPRGDVLINKVMPFGLVPAAYRWSRVGGSVGRLIQYIVRDRAQLWLKLVADDYDIQITTSSGSGHSGLSSSFLVFFLVMTVLRIPLSWHKTRGGYVYPWVGFEFHLESWGLGTI